jgi:thymidylate synthase (methanogen type)
MIIKKNNKMSDQLIEKIKNQLGSSGAIGWPVAVRDRIAFPPLAENIVTDANVAVTFLWTMRDDVAPKLEKSNLAIATNFYTPAGLQGMVRNILANPFIRYVILLGEEYSSKSAGDKISELTSANAIRKFFQEGVDSEGRLAGFENSIHFDKNIPVEMINLVKENVELIDLNQKMPNASLAEKVEEANRLIVTSQKKPSFSVEPRIFDYEEMSDSFPYEGGPLIVHGDNIPNAWIKMIYNIYRFGRKNLMNADTDRWIKEINNMMVVIHDPQNMDLSVNPFLVPLTEEKIAAYQAEILSPILPEGKAYTYGNKLRAYYYPAPEKVKELLSSQEYKDFEFGQGDWIDANVSYHNDYCEINQVQDIIDVLKRDRYSKASVAVTWHPADELMRKHKSSPCLVLIQALVVDEKLNLTVFFRSHDMTQGWPENAYGMAAIQKEVAEALEIPTGVMTIVSGSAQIYSNYYVQVQEMLDKYYKDTGFCSDHRGNFLISVDEQIIAKLTHSETGEELQTFSGTTAEELGDQIAQTTSLATSHAAYLGKELMKAEICLLEGQKYIQDKPLSAQKTEAVIVGERTESDRPDWDEYFMLQTILAAARSSCKHLQTGAVIVKDKRMIAMGYNGAPPNIRCCLDVGCRKDREGVGFEDKGKGVCRGVHAEINAINQIARQELKDTKMYTVYYPCSSCAKTIAGSGVKEVIYNKIYREPDNLTQEMFIEAGISLRQYDLDLDKNIKGIKNVFK